MLNLFLHVIIVLCPPDSGEHKNLAQYRQSAVFVNPIDQIKNTGNIVQSSSSYRLTNAKFEWKISESIQSLQDIFLANNEKKEGDGFRIQLLTSTDNNMVTKTRLQFLSKFPEAQVYTVYERPYFKLRAGDYVSKAEALRISGSYKIDFPAALVVPDKIKTNQKRKSKSASEKED